MDLAWLKPAVNGPGPFVSAHLDVSRDSQVAAHEIDLRWQVVRRQLEEQGASGDLVGQVEARMLAQTVRPGEAGRSVVAGPEGVVVDQVTTRRPRRDSGHYGQVPHLMPLLRGMGAAIGYAVVEADRAGADVTVVEPYSRSGEEHEVEGGHEVLHQVGGGGWSHRRYRNRVQDSWDRNAEAVAADVTKVFDRHHPEVIVVSGDPEATSRLLDRLDPDSRSRVVKLEGGGRPEGTDDKAFQQRIYELLTQRLQARMGDVLARYCEAKGTDSNVASGLAPVVAAVRGGSVQTLLLHDDPSSDLTLWAGEEPLQIGSSREEVEALGARHPVEDRADDILVRALVAQDAAIELVDVENVLPGGIGALLRFDVRPPVPGSGA
ncbi:MAG TPA: Vms1/Ankzf1 family peptidyl-tRNA hydrolase [Actinomycetales bacterium]|nr:Vms1/Ankzf1 family peptidyl-tRNA hydrolase [Actinomycetales bacterium]